MGMQGRVLSPTTKSEDGLDSRHAQHTGRMCDSPDGLFWILTPDGDVYPELLRVPLATGLALFNESLYFHVVLQNHERTCVASSGSPIQIRGTHWVTPCGARACVALSGDRAWVDF